MDILKKPNAFPAVIVYLNICTAFFLALLIAWTAVHASHAYYQVAPFHYDSAYYLFRSLQLYDIVHAEGKWAALLQVMQFDKDFLDWAVRILFFPYFLQDLHGHMAVVLPFLALFIFLILHYVFERTRSWALGLATAGLLFCGYFIYVPYQGIADYWKESIAIWILGSAVLSWLLADFLQRMRWSLLCSVLLGLLVMERSGLALYIGLLWAPLFLVAVYRRVKQDTWQQFGARTAVFVAPALLLTSFVAIVQGKLLYHYYFVKGYDYVSLFGAAKHLVWLVYHFDYFRLPIMLLGALAVYCLFFIKNWRQQWQDLLITAWFAAGFPLAIIGTRALYDGFYNSWYILLVTFFAALMPIPLQPSPFALGVRLNSPPRQKKFVMVLMSAVLVGSLLQYQLAAARTHALMAQFSSWRTFYNDLTDVVIAQPKPRSLIFLVDESFAPFFDHMKLNRGIGLNETALNSFMSVHDSYYIAEFGNEAHQIQKLAPLFLHGIENSGKDNLIVAYCNPAEVSQSPAFAADGKHIAIPMVTAQTEYLNHHPQWHVIKTMGSPYGCVNVYQFYQHRVV